MTELEKQIYASAFGWACAWGHNVEYARQKAEDAVRTFRKHVCVDKDGTPLFDLHPRS